MPLPLLPALIAGAGVVSSGVNAASTGRQNRKSRQHAREMYAQQVRDNERQWHMQNEYNDPKAQMARLRNAGLNPHMVYENGPTGSAGSIGSASAPSWSPDAPKIDLMSPLSDGLMAYNNIKTTELQNDNLKAQNTVLLNEAALKAGQLADVGARTARSKFDLELASALRENSMDFAKASLEKVKTDTQYQLNENERRNIHTSLSVSENLERVLNIRADTLNKEADRRRIYADLERLKKSNVLTDMDIEMRKLGINPNSPTYQQVIGRAANAIMDGTFIDSGKDWVKKVFKEAQKIWE